jgi:hypothetical protein
MKTLREAWQWYEDTKSSLRRMSRIGRVWWDLIPWDRRPWLGDRHFIELEKQDVTGPADNGYENLDDIAVVVLFSVFEATVRGEVLKQVGVEETQYQHRTIIAAIETAKERVSEGSFFAVLEPFKTADSNLIEQVHQVRKFRNWVSHGKRGEQPALVDPPTAYDRLTRCLNLLFPDVPDAHVSLAAYHIWLNETHPHGKAELHWSKARIRVQEMVRIGRLVI